MKLPVKLPRTRILVVVIAALVAGAGGATAYLMVRGGGQDLGPVIARVDGHPVFLREASARVQGLKFVHGNAAKSLGGTWRQEVLRSLVDDVILQEEADRRGIRISQKDLDANVATIRASYPTEAAFQGWLRGRGMTEQELDRRIVTNLLGARVYLAVTSTVHVSEAEIDGYYRQHRTEFRTSDGIAPLGEVHDAIRDELQQKAQDEAFQTWLAGRRRQVKVVMVMEDWWRRV